MNVTIDNLVRFIVAVLFNGLWEAALFALAAWAALRLMPAANATTRHAILAAALVASLVLPIVTAVPALQSAPAVHPATQVATRHRAGASAPVLRHSLTTAPAEAATIPPLTRPSLSLPRYLALAVVVLWVLGALFVIVRLIVSLLHLERLKRDALPVPVEYRAQLRRWTNAIKGSRPVRLCRSSEIVIPLAVGLFDAMILVPEHLLEDLEPRQVDQIVVHELAHLRRADDWINALERFAQALFFFNPGILWLIGQLDLEREVACDDWVLQQDQALPYATCLTKIVETTLWPHRAISAPGAFVTRRAMSLRIERLLSKHRDVRVKPSLGPTGVAVAALLALCIGAAFVSPSFAYTASPSPVTQSKPSVRVEVERTRALVRVHRLSTPEAPVVAVSARPKVEKYARSSSTAAPRIAAVVASPRAVATAPAVVATAHAVVGASTVVVAASPAVAAVSPAVVADATATDYIRELASVGYTGLSIDDLVRLRSVGVTADYIRGLAAAGLQHPSVRDLVELRTMSVEPDFVRSIRQRFGSTTIRDLTALKAVGVTPDYIDELSSSGLKDLTIREVGDLRAMSVSPEYIRDLIAAGYPNLTPRELEDLKAMSIDGDFVRRAAADGYHNLSVKQLLELKAMNILPK
jgi:beta-lactamase regulating signal transducer with metallopeptidase domain